MAIFFNGGEEDTLAEAIHLSASGVYAFAVFNLLTFPCFAAIATAKAEQTRKEFLKTLGFWFGISYVLSAVIYWLGSLWGVAWWAGLLVTVTLIAGLVVAAYFVVKRNKKASAIVAE